ncbi:hypothetical protein OPV22_021930 [Ensete ventricosum]|uniref:Uncharacterized protein n=1 Tax=Ensete ventricosum TaxID=4639 RepID=A0AAV8QMC4_ENSVE|nr:hypothetical protein OPV22_021930 [Ensete ventricosum]
MAAAKAPMQRGDRLRQGTLQRGSRLRLGPACKGGGCPPAARPQGQPPEGGRLQCGARKGRQPPTTTPQELLPTVCRRPPAASPQGVADCGFGACKKVAYGLRHRPQGLLPLGRVAADGQGQPPPAQGQ